MVDIDANEMNKPNLKLNMSIQSDIKKFSNRYTYK